MPQVIEWKNPSAEAILWRYPNEEITWGAQLIVHEYEVAVFFRDGKSYDVFGAGRHTLTTLNLPLVTGLLTRIAGYGEKPFKATVIFVSTKVFAGKYGTRAQTTELAPLQVHGSFWFKVENPQLFVNEVVGGQKALKCGNLAFIKSKDESEEEFLSEKKDFYEKAKKQMRLSERIVAAMPGFRGYKEKELRRESDRLIRNHLYRRLSAAKSDLRDVFQKLSDRRLFEVLTDVDRLVAKFDRVAAKIDHASYGYTGFFNIVKVEEANLDRMIDFDNKLVDADG